MTPSPAEPRAWSECPQCSGYGEHYVHPGALLHLGVRGDGRDHKDDKLVPCDLCAAHFAALDAAVREEREAVLLFTLPLIHPKRERDSVAIQVRSRGRIL